MTEDLATNLASRRFPAVALPGLRPTSLGCYLASLGVLRVLTRKWSSVRLAWRADVPHLVAGPTDVEELATYLCEVAQAGSWTEYQVSWADVQKRGTKAKSGEPLAVWRGEAKESEVERLDVHLIPATRQFFNPLLGSGGNAGKRKFADGWVRAVAALRPNSSKDEPKRSKRKKATTMAKPSVMDGRKQDLEAWLLGQPVTFLLEKLQAASWFSDANKLFNSGQRAAREGQLSPWAMVLACEGLNFFAGSPSRRLGAGTRPQGAFPFVTVAAAPETEGTVDRDRGEVWAPLWSRPATMPEIVALFARGRAEIGGRGAVTPAAFAAAILRRGVDAGIVCFYRFALGATTSANTFEPRLLGRIAVPDSGQPVTGAAGTTGQRAASILEHRPPWSKSYEFSAIALERLLGLLDRLPREKKVGKRWRYHGLRGPLEVAMVRLAEEPLNHERACAVLDATAVALDRVDRNRTFRKAGVRWMPPPLEWLSVPLGDTIPSVEVRLAGAIVSSFPAERPFALYRFGVERAHGWYRVPETPPSSWVWGDGRLVSSLVRVIQRRTLDLSDPEHDRDSGLREGWYATWADITAWLSGAVDDVLLDRWLARLALFDWYRSISRPSTWSTHADHPLVTGAIAIHALLLPLLDRRPVIAHDNRDLLSEQTGARTPATARRLVTLLRTGDLNAALTVARSRYAMAATPLARIGPFNWTAPDAARLLTALLVPVSDLARARLIVQRWLRPSRPQGGQRHA